MSDKQGAEYAKHYLNEQLSGAGYRFNEEIFKQERRFKAESPSEVAEEEDEAEERWLSVQGSEVLKNFLWRCCEDNSSSPGLTLRELVAHFGIFITCGTFIQVVYEDK